MRPSLHHSKGRASSEPSPQRKISLGEQPSLQELLPEETLKLLPTLSGDDKEVLHFLVLFGRSALHPPEAASVSDGQFSRSKEASSVSAGESSRSKTGVPQQKEASSVSAGESSPSKAHVRQQVLHSCPFSDAFDASIPLAEEGFSLLKKHIVSSCNCFVIYSKVWGRWNASCNRDVISDILDYLESPLESTPHGTPVKPRSPPESTLQGVSQGSPPENTPQGSPESTPQGIVAQGGKGKKKKKSDKKKGTSEKKVEKDQSSHTEPDPSSSSSFSYLSFISEPTNADCDVNPEVGATMPIEATTGHKKSLLRGLKHKQKTVVTSPNTGGIVENAISSESAARAVTIEIPEDVTNGQSACRNLGQGKNITKLQPHRPGKRRSNQILPIDCEEIAVADREQEAIISVENTQTSMSPRAADIGLGGRGFLARVFPDALGRVASRLWDLVSVRLRSCPVEYH